MYVDFEFRHDDNPQLDESAVLKTLISLLCHCLNVDYNVAAVESDVLVLDSNSQLSSQEANKSSYHMIFQLRRFVFEDNSVCGGFMHDVYAALMQFLQSDQQSKYLPHPHLSRSALQELVVANGAKMQFVADLSVYSRNRQFR
jgi:hypothetical protein